MADDESDGAKFEPKSLFIKITVFICVLFIGAIIFVAIETTEAEKESGSQILPNVSEISTITSKYNISGEDFEKLRALIKNDILKPDKVNWSFGKAVFLTFTIMTTIGRVLKVIFVHIL